MNLYGTYIHKNHNLESNLIFYIQFSECLLINQLSGIIIIIILYNRTKFPHDNKY